MNKISDDLILNSPNGSNGFSLTHINMYILHVYLHVKKYVADITFSIILKIKVPTFRSFLKKKVFKQYHESWSMKVCNRRNVRSIRLKGISNVFFFRISDAITYLSCLTWTRV